MQGELLILFVILLLGLILCSFLGGSKCVEGMESGTVYYGPNGAIAFIETETGNLVVTASDGTVTTYTVSTSSSNTYYAANGASATITNGSNGMNSVQVKDANGNVVLTLTNNPNTGVSTATTSSGTTVSTDYDNYNHYSGTSSPTIYYGPDGGTAKVITTPENNSIVITYKNGATEIYYVENNGNTVDPEVSVYYGPNGGSAKLITVDGKQAVEITTPNGSKVVYNGDNAYTYNSQDGTINQYDADNNSTGSDYNTAYTNTYYGPNGGQVNTVTGPAGNTYASYDSSAYYNSLPTGIPRSQIPPGEEDLYILKSQVVPPVCPKCPDPIIYSGNDPNKCPPCPPCARCPEPSFTCEKVFSANSVNSGTFPMPVLSDFSTFGM
jgi:hypothetical protein